MLTSVCLCVEVCSSQLTRLYGHCGWHCVTHSLYVVVGRMLYLPNYITCEGARIVYFVWRLDYGLDNVGFDSQQGQEIFPGVACP